MNYELRHGLSGEVYFATSESQNNLLSHWGVKGMKWGVRRYQNKDGSLTPRGQKRYKTEMAKLKEEEKIIKRQEANKAKAAKIEAKRRELDARKKALNSKEPEPASTQKAKPKSGVKDMSDADLKNAIARMQDERTYFNLQQDLSRLNPKPVSKGQKFMNSLMNDVVAPAVKNAGKQWLEKKMKDALGLKEDKKLSWDDALKKQTWEKNKANEKVDDLIREIELLNKQQKVNELRGKLQEQERAEKAAAEEAKRQTKEAKRQEREAKRQARQSAG